jgi:hypothetical protein
MSYSNQKLFICIVVATLCQQTDLATAEPDDADGVFTNYARYGADVWARNPLARISGDGNACISCHTSLPYALVEPLLPDSYSAYDNMIENIDNRIRTWNDNIAWYSDPRLEQMAAFGDQPPDALKGFLDGPDSRGVEAVFNALISGMQDAYADQPASRETELAFENMWAEQIESGPEAGRWGWIMANLVPWEVADSDIWGASLACVAASRFPDLAPPGKLELLDASLRRAAEDTEVSLHAKAGVLWCDAESKGRVLDNETATGLIGELLPMQQENGGWGLRDLGPWPGWEGSDSDCCAAREIRSDAYATGFVTLVLARNAHRVPADQQGRLKKSLTWINRRLEDPYPTGPRYNKHNSSDRQIPEFRDSLYTNAGFMWAYLARHIIETGKAPWEKE